METKAWAFLGLWMLSVYSLHQACARMQDKLGNGGNVCQHGCKGDGIQGGAGRGWRMEGWIKEVVRGGGGERNRD